MLARLVQNLRRGHDFTTDYSGLGCPEEVLRTVTHAMQHAGMVPGGTSPFRALRSCDWNRLSQQCLLHAAAMQAAHNEQRPCVFKDIQDRLPVRAKDHLDSALVMSSGADAKQLFRNQARWLSENADWVFPPDATSACLTHGRQCRVHPSPRIKEDVYKRRKLDPLRMLWNVAGSTCTGWSSVGRRKGEEDINMRYFNIWRAERAQGYEDGWFHECTVHFPDRLLHETLEDCQRVRRSGEARLAMYPTAHLQLWPPQGSGAVGRASEHRAGLHGALQPRLPLGR